MPGRCVGPSRSGRVARRPRGKKWIGTSRGRGGRRRARASVWGTRCVSAEKPQGCRQPCGGRRAAETAEGPGANEASRTPGTAGSTEAAKDPGAVLVNGAAGEPQVVGPAGSVWVTGTGDEEQPAYRSPRGCERKGRPGSMGQESILELWLKVQAMRAASGCGERSRVELHPVPAGQGPVERGVPGRASWVETSRRGLTGPWVEGQVRAVPQASGGPTATGLRAGCERLPGLRGLGPAVRLPPGGVPGAAETSSGIAPHLLGRGQAVGVPGTVEEIGYEVAPGPWGKGPIMGVPGAVGWPEAVEGEVGCGGAPGLWQRGQSGQVPGALVQEAVSGDTLWGRGQAVEVPRAVEETPSVGAPGMWPRRPALEEIGPGGIPDLWVSRQPVGVPCAVEEETRCGGDPGFRERGQAVWVETGSAGDPGSWEVAQTVGVSGPEEQEAGPGGAPGLWRVGQALGVPRALGKEAGWGSVPGLWGTDQPGGVAQAGVVPGAIGEQPRVGGIPGLWDKQQALGVPLADAVPGGVGEETCCENVLSLWERRQAVGEQEALVPTALGVPGSVGQEAGYRDVSCLCRRRQAAGLSETAGMSEASGVPKHRCAPTGVPAALGVPGSGRVPAAVWVSGPVCPEVSSRDVLNLWESVHTAGTPLAPGVPVASEELLAVRENAGSAAFPRLWGRRPVPGLPVTDRVAVAPEVPGLAGEETGSGGVPRSWGRRQSARVPVAVEVPTAPRVPCPLGVETGSGGFSPSPGRRQTVGVPVTVGLPGPVEEETLSGGLSGLSGRRQTAEMPVAARVSMAVGVPTAAGASGLVVGDTSAGDVTGAWGRRLAMERPTAARASGPVGRETGSEGVPGLWRRPTTVVPEAVRVPLSLGVLAGVGVPMAGHVPAAVWVSGSTGEETTAAGSGLTVVTRQSARGPGASGEQTGGGSILGLAGRSQAAGVSYTHGHGTRSWSCPGSVGEETDCENVSGTRTTREVNEAVEVSSVSMGIGRFRDHPQQRGRRQPGGVSGMRVRGDNLGENCVGEDRLRGAFL